jgi:hypothetical protein
MTKEQLDALEDWFVAVIRDENHKSDLSDAIRRRSLREIVEQVFKETAPPAQETKA